MQAATFPVVQPPRQPPGHQDEDGTAGTGIDVDIATKDVLNESSGLIDQNTTAVDNNVFVSRSNAMLTQNDKLRTKTARKVVHGPYYYCVVLSEGLLLVGA